MFFMRSNREAWKWRWEDEETGEGVPGEGAVGTKVLGAGRSLVRTHDPEGQCRRTTRGEGDWPGTHVKVGQREFSTQMKPKASAWHPSHPG